MGVNVCIGRRGEWFAECAVVETVGYEGRSIMVWGSDARTVNARRYVTEVLEPLVILFALFSSETCN